MARGLNKVLLIGNLGKDPEMKYTPQGTAITTFSVAVDRSRKTPDGQWVDETEWFRIVAWEKLAETCNEYLRKGSKVYVEGRLHTRSWEKDGQKQFMTEVVANEMIMLDRREGGPGPGGPVGAYSTEDRASKPGGSFGGGFEDDADSDVDDIPF
jgi:single-strand DNA-binding protein